MPWDPLRWTLLKGSLRGPGRPRFRDDFQGPSLNQDPAIGPRDPRGTGDRPTEVLPYATKGTGSRHRVEQRGTGYLRGERGPTGWGPGGLLPLRTLISAPQCFEVATYACVLASMVRGYTTYTCVVVKLIRPIHHFENEKYQNNHRKVSFLGRYRGRKEPATNRSRHLVVALIACRSSVTIPEPFATGESPFVVLLSDHISTSLS